LEHCALALACAVGIPVEEEHNPDAVQEVLLWAWTNFGQLLNLGEEEAKRLVQRVWDARAADVSRGRNRQERLLHRYAEQLGSDEQEAPASDTEPLEMEGGRVLAAALKSLSATYHDVVVWHFLEKQTWYEVGRRLGCTERHARRLGDKALNILRVVLEGRV
jgi:DNA-directed RNA polymerase specialized sigma24 family protein